jgi:pyruvate formate-lyase activating enzyme-like uncharacterized protein
MTPKPCKHCKGTKILVVDRGLHTTNCFYCNPSPKTARWGGTAPEPNRSNA